MLLCRKGWRTVRDTVVNDEVVRAGTELGDNGGDYLCYLCGVVNCLIGDAEVRQEAVA